MPVRLDALSGCASRRSSTQPIGVSRSADALRIDRPGDDQAIDRARHGDVVETEPLLTFLISGGLPHVLQVEDPRRSPRVGCTIRKPNRPSESATISSRAARAPHVAPGVRHDHDLELEALRAVDRQQPHRPAALLLRDGLELLRAERLLITDEADEPRESAPRIASYSRASRPSLRRFAKRRDSVPAREHREVVVVLAQDAVAQSLEPDPDRRADESLVALEECAQEPLVLWSRLLGQGALERGEERPARGVAAKQDERVVRDADERRREDRGQRDVVVAVVQEPQVREQIDDLLLSEVPATRRAIRRQPLAPERLLVALGVRTRREQHDDLARLGLARVDELAHSAAIRRASPSASARRCRGKLALSVTRSSTGWPNTGSANSAEAASGWYSSPNAPPKRWFTAASTCGRER